MRTEHVPSGAAVITADIHGEEHDRTLILLHPGVADRRCWSECAQVWAAQGWRVVAYDRRGFGDTVYEPEPHDDVADLLAVADYVGARPAVLVGCSMGGALALDAAVAHPDRVSALVLIGAGVSGAPTPDLDRVPEAALELDRACDAARDAGDVELANRLDAHLWLDGALCPEGRVDGGVREQFLTMNGRALRAPDPGPDRERPGAWQRLADLDAPVLVVTGAHDLAYINEWSAQLAARLPRARTVELPDSAHLPMLDAPQALSAAVADFLTDLEGP